MWMPVRIRVKMAQRKKLTGPLLSLQPLFAVEPLVANDGWVASPVKAVSRRGRGPQASLYRACHPAILGHRGRRLATAQPGVSKPGRSTHAGLMKGVRDGSTSHQKPVQQSQQIKNW